MAILYSRFLIRGVGLIFLVGLLGFAFPPVFTLDLRMDGVIPKDGAAEFYYSSDLAQFDPEDRIGSIRVIAPEGQAFLERIETSRAVRFIRLDPVAKPSRFELRGLTMRGDSGERHYSAFELVKGAVLLDQLEVLSASPDAYQFSALGPDAKIVLAVPREITARSRLQRLRYWLSLLAVSGALVILGDRVLAWRKRPPLVLLKADHYLGSLGRRLSDESTIVFSAAAMWVYTALLALFAGWVGLQLHQSSVGIWDDLYATVIPESSVRIGAPRAIRSDEWNTFTPWMLSQVQNGMQVDNPNLGANASAILTGAPVAGPLLLAQPKYWGFALFDISHGFSWFWAVKVFGLIGAFFTLLLALTRGDAVVSLAGAIAVYGASLVQWWFSGIAPELLMGFSMSVVGSLYLLRASKVSGMVFGAIIIALVIPNLLMHIYPPHLLPLAYLAVFVVAGLMINSEALRNFRYRLGLRMVVVGGMLLVLIYLVRIWYRLSIDTIHLMLNTVYPGKRFLLGGDLDLDHVFHGIFESWRIDEWPLPFSSDSNQTAASQMWVLFPLAFFFVPLKSWGSQICRIPAALMLYCLVVLTWTSLPIPAVARNLMAHAGWSLSPPWNAVIGMGVASMILMCMLIAGSAKGDMVLNKLPRSSVPLLSAVAVLAFGLHLRSLDPEFFVFERIAVAALFFAAFAWAVHQGQRWWFLLLCLVSAIPGMQVNPVRNDLGAYLGKTMFVQAKAVGGAEGDKWAVFGDVDVAQGFKSVGLTVVNGSHYAPRMSFVDVLDPSHRYVETWNRYAHIGFATAMPGDSPVFALKFADQYEVEVHVCGRELQALGVTHVAYSYPPSQAELRCLLPIPRAISEGIVTFYRLKSDGLSGS